MISFFFSSRRRHTRLTCDWSSDVCSSDLLPYMKAWHAKYREDGLRVVGVHSAAFPPSEDTEEVKAAVARLGIEHPVVIDERRSEERRVGKEGRSRWSADR